MFTGIVEDMGTVVEWSATGPEGGWLLTIQPDHPDLFFVDKTADTYVGASICVSGVCLTVISYDSKTLKFGVAPETIRKTNFGSFKAGISKVNLERGSLSSRNSGHYVQGHVDGVGQIIEKWKENDSLWFKVKVPKELIKGIVSKGFIAIEGTSLTVCDVSSMNEPYWFTFMLIDHTQKHVVIPSKLVGETLNLECDIMAKYAISGNDELKTSLLSLEAKVNALENRLKKLEMNSKL